MSLFEYSTLVDGDFFGAPPLLTDGWGSAVLGGGRCNLAKVLVAAALVLAVNDEAGGHLERTGQAAVLKEIRFVRV